MEHDLKIAPEYFDAVKEGRKPFEIRRNDDRTFAFGDTLLLREWDVRRYHPRPNDPLADKAATDAAYTGRKIRVWVFYILTEGVFWQGRPAAVLGIQRVPLFQHDSPYLAAQRLDRMQSALERIRELPHTHGPVSRPTPCPTCIAHASLEGGA